MNNTVYRHRFLFQEDSDKSVHCDCCRIIANPNRKFRVLYRDRYNFLNQYSPVNWYNKDYTSFHPQNDINLNFEDLCLNKLEGILKNWNRVNVMWSGGIDSDIIAAGLYSLSNEYNCKDKVVFYCTKNSIEYFKEGYDKLRKVFKFVIIENDEDLVKRLYDDTPKDACIVNGDSGVIFGQKAIDDQYCNLNYKDALINLQKDGKIYNSKTIEVIEEYLKLFDVEIKTFYDLFKLFQSSFVTEFGQGLFLLSIKALDPTFDRMISFFTDDVFSRWFFANFHKIPPFYSNDMRGYKIWQKDFIFKHLKTSSVFNIGKDKGTSFRADKMSPNIRKRVIIIDGNNDCNIFERPDNFPQISNNYYKISWNVEFSNFIKKEFFYKKNYVNYE